MRGNISHEQTRTETKGQTIIPAVIVTAEYRYKIVTFLYKLGQLMPVSNSFRCVCKFANRAAIHHKVNYIAPEGMSNGRQAIFDSSDLSFSSISLCCSRRLR